MAVSLKHTFQSAKSDGADSTLVQPSNWNAEHTLTAAAGKVLGRDTSGAGAVQELPIAVDTSGNVGVGTSSPATKLAVNDSARASVYVITSDTGVSNQINFVNGSNFGAATIGTVSGTGGSGGDVFGLGYSPAPTTSDFTSVLNWTSGGRIGVGTASPATTFDVNGAAAQNVVAVSASAVDCATGNYFTKTASGALTWTFTNVPASRSFAFALQLTNGGSGTQTWPAAVVWNGGTAPTLQTSGTDIVVFVTSDGGTTWRGVRAWKQA